MATLTAEFQYLGRSEKLAPKSGSYGYYILLYGKTEPNVETGFHAVTIREVMACTANSSFYNFASYYSGAVDGKTAFSGSKKPSSAWELGSFTAGGVSYSKGTVIAEGTIQVDATNGVARTAALSCLWKMNVDASATYVPAKGATGSVSVMAELSAIPRASSVTASDAYIGSSSIITINRSSSAFRHTLSYRMDGQDGFTTIADKTESAQYGWTVPDEAYALIPNGKEIDITIRCETYSGAVSLGYKETVMVASTRESACKPIIEAVSAIDVNPKTVALTGDNKVFVRGHSNAKVVTVATAQNKSSISSIVVSAGGKKAEGADVTIEGIETEIVVVTVTDSRGYSDTYTVPWRSLVNYVPLTLNLSISREAPSSDVVHITATGQCFNGSFGAVDNALGVVMHYRPLGGSYGDDVALSVSRSGNTYTATGTLPGLVYTNIYEVEVIASDAISNIPVTDKIKKGVPVYHWGEDFFRFHVPTTIPAEEPIVVPGAGTSDSAIDGEILAYAAGMGEGYFKFIYSPAAVHGVLGGSSLLVECFRVGGASAYALALRVSSVGSGDIVSYVAKYETDGGFSGWRGVGGQGSFTVDSALSSTSTNPVQNKVVNSALAGKAPSGYGFGESANVIVSDIDSIAKTGFYQFVTDEFDNAAADYYLIHQIHNANYACQTAIKVINANAVYQRVKRGGQWEAWIKYITSGNIGSQSVANATNSNKLVPSSTTRPSSANLSATGDRSIQHLLATSSMSTGKPADDGHILHMEWDNTGGWSSQVFVPHGKNYHMQYRMMHDGTWQPWRTLLDSASTVQMSQGGTGGTSGQTGLQNLLAAGVMILSAHQYGTSLPSAGTPGRIFFKKAGS